MPRDLHAIIASSAESATTNSHHQRLQDGDGENAEPRTPAWFRKQWLAGNRGPRPQPADKAPDLQVIGGYIERLPLAVLKAGIVDCAEVWTHWHGATPPIEQPGASHP
ncbi:hypothetical protein ACOJBM_35270 [Rhizobium beringeri]